LLASVVDIFDVVLFEELIGEVGTGFEGEALREDERVVAVEEEGCDLERQLRIPDEQCGEYLL